MIFCPNPDCCRLFDKSQGVRHKGKRYCSGLCAKKGVPYSRDGIKAENEKEPGT